MVDDLEPHRAPLRDSQLRQPDDQVIELGSTDFTAGEPGQVPLMAGVIAVLASEVVTGC